jgi:dolichyl-phosphate beta-glucosyltransferase
LVMVDDGSLDGTRKVLEALARELPDVSVLALDRNAGKAEAVRRGMQKAFEERAEAAGYWDADLSAPLEESSALLKELEEDPALLAVFGSRVKRLGAGVERSAFRHLLGRAFGTAVGLLTGLPAYDTQCGAKVFRAGPAVKALFDKPFMSRWAFDVEILARLKEAGHDPAQRVLELPLRRWRHAEGSKMSWPSGLKAGLDLIRIRARYGAALTRPSESDKLKKS